MKAVGPALQRVLGHRRPRGPGYHSTAGTATAPLSPAAGLLAPALRPRALDGGGWRALRPCPRAQIVIKAEGLKAMRRPTSGKEDG